jgi:hypothetical protein
MTGIETRRMRRRPRRSMSRRERIVKEKFVTATERDVRVGEENPIKEKMVAEKYIREFCDNIRSVMRIVRNNVSITGGQGSIRNHKVAGGLEAYTLLPKLGDFPEQGRAPTSHRLDWTSKSSCSLTVSLVFDSS